MADVIDIVTKQTVENNVEEKEDTEKKSKAEYVIEFLEDWIKLIKEDEINCDFENGLFIMGSGNDNTVWRFIELGNPTTLVGSLNIAMHKHVSDFIK